MENGSRKSESSVISKVLIPCHLNVYIYIPDLKNFFLYH